jgi:hypothetical protein
MLILFVGLLCTYVVYVLGLFTTLALAAFYLYTKRYNDNGENLRANRYWQWFHERAALVVAWIGKKGFSYKIVYHGGSGSIGGDSGLEYIATEGAKDTIFCASPHGLFPIASLLHLAQPDWKRVRPGVHRNSFWLPGLRDFLLWCGAFSPTRDNIKEVLTKNPVYINIDGSREMLSSPSSKKHRGILEVAYNEGKFIIPVIHQGQENVFQCFTFDFLEKVRTFFMDNTGYAFPTFFSVKFRPLTTHIYEPMNPSSYESCDAFVDAYYNKVDAHKTELRKGK